MLSDCIEQRIYAKIVGELRGVHKGKVQLKAWQQMIMSDKVPPHTLLNFTPWTVFMMNIEDVFNVKGLCACQILIEMQLGMLWKPLKQEKVENTNSSANKDQALYYFDGVHNIVVATAEEFSAKGDYELQLIQCIELAGQRPE
jgi:hypothetical protein